MARDQVIGHTKVLGTLDRAFATDRVSHAYLITGPPHIGKMMVAKVLARQLNCLGDGRRCDNCDQCCRISRGVHTDVVVVSVDTEGLLHEDGKPRTMITLEQVREVSRDAVLRPFEGRHRVFIFEDADRLTEEASNALLKTLEEPPSEVVIVLLSSDLKAVLPTIVSRCQVFSLKPIPWPLLSQALTDRFNIGEELALQIARTSAGRAGIALRMATDTEFGVRREETLDRIESTATANLEVRLNYAKYLSALFVRDRAQAREEIVQWRDWWRDVMLAVEGMEEYVNHTSRVDSIRQIATIVGIRGAACGVKASLDAITHLDMNVAPALAIEQMMLKLPNR